MKSEMYSIISFTDYLSSEVLHPRVWNGSFAISKQKRGGYTTSFGTGRYICKLVFQCGKLTQVFPMESATAQETRILRSLAEQQTTAAYIEFQPV